MKLPLFNGYGGEPYKGLPEDRFKYNGKELVESIGWYDYGARMYDPTIGRWNAVDPLSDKWNMVSPYLYALNNPIKFIDIEGRDIGIVIGAKSVGTTQIRLIGSEYVRGAPKTVEVPLYEMTVTDDVSGKSTNYLVTRDGPFINGEKDVDRGFFDDTFKVTNTAFEPKGEKGKYKGVPLDYPEGMEAYALRNKDGSTKLQAEKSNSPFRKKKDIAEGVMIHVGGEYTSSDGSRHTTGSEGCFTLSGKYSGNKGINQLKNDIAKRLTLNKKAGTGTNINITVEKRKNVQQTWNVDDDGKKQ